MHIIILNQELSKVYVEKDIFRTEINATRKLKSQTKKLQHMLSCLKRRDLVPLDGSTIQAMH